MLRLGNLVQDRSQTMAQIRWQRLIKVWIDSNRTCMELKIHVEDYSILSLLRLLLLLLFLNYNHQLCKCYCDRKIYTRGCELRSGFGMRVENIDYLNTYYWVTIELFLVSINCRSCCLVRSSIWCVRSAAFDFILSIDFINDIWKIVIHTFKFFIPIAKSNIFFVPRTLISTASRSFSLNFTDATTLKTICVESDGKEREEKRRENETEWKIRKRRIFLRLSGDRTKIIDAFVEWRADVKLREVERIRAAKTTK